MSRSSDLHLHLSEERRWRGHMTEEEERLAIIAYTKGMDTPFLQEPQPEPPLEQSDLLCEVCGHPSHTRVCLKCRMSHNEED